MAAASAIQQKRNALLNIDREVFRRDFPQVRWRRNGFDGSPGRGGTITVTYDPQAKPFLTAIHISNQGGPSPVFKEEPMDSLW